MKLRFSLGIFLLAGLLLIFSSSDTHALSGTPTPTALTLAVDLTAATDGINYQQSLSGNAPLANISLRALVSGTKTGLITYIFNCGDGTPPITVSNTNTNPDTVSSVCNYAVAGTYTATVTVQR